MNKAEHITLQKVLHTALDELGRLLPLTWKPTLRPNKKQRPDDQVVIFKSGEEIYRADTIIQPHFKDEHIARNLNRLKDGQKVLIVAEYIPAKTKELLRDQHIDYLDVNGNCYINTDGANLFLNIDGKKNAEYRKEKFHRPFAKAGLKVTYLFLNQPKMLNAPYREIAKQAGVALGNIKHIIDGLIEEDFVAKKNNAEYVLKNFDELLDRWARAYGEKLRPNLEVGTFRFLQRQDPTQWWEIGLNTEKTCWGGEPAAEMWTNYLKPEIFTLYTTETKQDLIRNYKLVPDPEGNIKAYRKFWKEEGKDGIKTNAILTYADLVLTKDMRCLETAHMLYEKYIDEKLQST